MPPTPDQERMIAEEKLAVLATLRRDGTPQLTPVNYVYEDGLFFVSTTRDRAKYYNVRRNHKVSLCIVRPEGRPYVTVFGRATIEEDRVEEGTAAIFRRITERPLPEDFDSLLRQQGRVLLIVTPEHFVP